MWVAVFRYPTAKGLTLQANEEKGRWQRDVFLPSDWVSYGARSQEVTSLVPAWGSLLIHYSPCFRPIIQYLAIFPENAVPQKLKIELFSGICPPFYPKGWNEKKKCLLLDKKCCISQYVALIHVLHRLPEKVLSHFSLRHRTLIMEENSSNTVSNAVRGPFIPRNN